MTADLKLLNSVSEDVQIDERASVHPSVQLGAGCVVGPFAVVERDVVLGDNCEIHPHGVVRQYTRLGVGNRVHPFACIGGDPQDLRHQGEQTSLEIGNYNDFREYVTVGRGTVHGGGVTRIGDHNLIMAHCHVAHDCVLGNRVVLANNTTLAGHSVVGDYVVSGGGVQVASFVRIGESAMLAAGAQVERWVPPFAMVAGNRARLIGVNRVGMGRRGMGEAVVAQVKLIIRKLKLTTMSVEQVVGLIDEEDLFAESRRLLAFLNMAQDQAHRRNSGLIR